MKLRTAILLAIVLSASLVGQNPGPVYPVNTAPSGSCGSNVAQLVAPGGTLSTCQNGTWGQISGGGGGGSDIPSFVIANAAGGGSEVSANYYFISNPNGVTFAECGASLAIAPTGSSLIIDIQAWNGSSWVSVFSTTKIVFTTAASSPSTVFQSTFASSPYTAAKGVMLRAQVTQNDSGNTAQFAYVKCRMQ